MRKWIKKSVSKTPLTHKSPISLETHAVIFQTMYSIRYAYQCFANFWGLNFSRGVEGAKKNPPFELGFGSYITRRYLIICFKIPIIIVTVSIEFQCTLHSVFTTVVKSGGVTCRFFSMVYAQ